MAEYTRFEVYIPVHYTIEEKDRNGERSRPVTHALDLESIEDFIRGTYQRFRGVTIANPHAPVPLKGYWNPRSSPSRVTVDYMTYIFTLVPIHESDLAMDHFIKWKSRLEKNLNQDLILIISYPVHSIGDFF